MMFVNHVCAFISNMEKSLGEKHGTLELVKLGLSSSTIAKHLIFLAMVFMFPEGKT